MGDWAPVVGMSALALIAGATVVLRGPMGKALAEWIRGWSHTEKKWIEAKSGMPSADVVELRAEVDELHRQLGEVQERLDFAERLLARERAPDRLGPGAKA